MKRLITLLLSLVMCLSVMTVPAVLTAGAAAEGEQISYNADFSAGVPSDWKLYNKSDVSNSTIAKSGNAVKIGHNNGSINASLYYGALYEVATDLGNVKDFELTISFRFTRWLNSSRWFGVFYHTQKQNGKLEGYLMNVRVNGNSAQSSVTTVPSFTDTAAVETKINLADQQFHTLKITVNNGIATHYLDSIQTISYALEEKYGLMGGVLEDGGFGVVACNSDVEIASFSLTGTQGGQTPTKSQADNTIANTYTLVSDFATAPSVITDITSAGTVNMFAQPITPATAIAYVDENMNVLDKNGEVIKPFDEIYLNSLKGKIIPAVYVKNQAQADAFLNYLSKVRNLLDIAVVSNDANLVSYVRQRNLKIRGIVDYSGEDYDKEDMAELLAESNRSCANIVILNEKTATRENVTFLHARFKAVWVRAEDSSRFNIASLVSTGSLGIITGDVETAYDTLRKYKDNSFARTPFNIAHRGLCATNYENSLEGFVEAYQKGATHVEIDIHLSKDGELVVMHDSSINRTTNGTGNVADMTLAQLSQYKIIKNTYGAVLGEGVKIPTLRDIFEVFKGTDLVLVLEIKTGNLNAPKAIKALAEEYDIMSQCVVIAFGVGQLEQMQKDLPEMPKANLNNISIDNFATVLYNSNFYNAVIDCHYACVNNDFTNRVMKDRGFLGFFWTYGNYGEIANHFTSGVTGMTNNAADSIADYTREITTEKPYVLTSSNGWNSAKYDVKAIAYDGTETTVQAKVFLAKEKEDGLYAILSYKYVSGNSGVSYTVYTAPVKVIFEEDYMSPEEIVEGINALPKNITLEDGDTIRALRKAYDALIEEEKALVTNEAKLVGLENTLERLENAQTSESESSTNSSTSEAESESGSSPVVSASCNSSASGSLAVSLVCLGALAVLKRKKKQ